MGFTQEQTRIPEAQQHLQTKDKDTPEETTEATPRASKALASDNIGISSLNQDPGNIKYGDNTPDLYTGTVSASIPLYTYQDQDFTIPISIDYTSSGYKTNSRSGIVGLGWNLSAGGHIIQRIRDIPDFGKNMNITSPYFSLVSLTLSDSSQTSSFPYDSITLNEDHIYWGGHTYQVNGGTESSPDIFSFNFMGHSGKFMSIGDKIRVFDSNDPHGEYYFDFYTKQSLIGNNISYNLCIITGDGYFYEFYSPALNDLFTDELRKDWESLLFEGPMQVVWNLTKITAPNGRTVLFEYEDSYITNCTPADTIDLSGSGKSLIPDLEYQKVVSKTSFLKAINIDQKVGITFSRNKQAGPELKGYYENNGKTDLFSLGSDPFLESIEIYRKETESDSTLLKKCDFKYKYTDGNPVMLLDSLTISGVGSFKMDYYGQNDRFPYQGTPNIDHWNYYNAGYRDLLDDNDRYGINYYPINISFPDSLYFAELDFNLVTPRKPDYTYAKKGMLYKITYPTGGYTTFEYEPHQYKDMVTRDRSSQNLPYLKIGANTDRIEAGGLRISKITDHTMDGVTSSKRYYYETSDGACSGNLLVRPFYYFYMDEYSRGTTQLTRTKDIWLHNYVNNTKSDDFHIEYESVKEVFDDNSYIVYNFANYHDFPDIYGSRNHTLLNPRTQVSNNILVNNFLREPDFQSCFRGTLLSTSIYSANATTPSRVIEQIYDTEMDRNNFVESVLYAADYFYIQRSYPESFPLIEKKVTDYFSGTTQEITSNIKYQYNEFGQTTCINENNGSRITYITYVTDIPSDKRTEIQQLMYDTNHLSNPIASRTSIEGHSYRPSNTEFIIDANQYDYTYIPIPTSENEDQYIFLHTRFSDRLISTTDPKLIVIKEHRKAHLDDDPTIPELLEYYTVKSYDKYDEKGNLWQETNHLNGLTTSYIWGYGGLYPVANITGDPTNIETVLGPYYGTQEAALPSWVCDGVRNLGRVITTFYEYDPFIGITKIVDSTGRARTFTYNANGQLSGEYDEDGNPIRTYTYSTDNK